MFRRLSILASLWACAGGVLAQDLSTIQIHGFATQGFLYSSTNNYLSANTSGGSLAWNDGAVSVSDSLSDKLRVGIQLHMYQLGDLGGPTLQVDWATGDYKLNEHFGFRAGKFKIPIGLFNDSQDVDAVHLWALLPQSIYPTDNRSVTLSAMGGECYGIEKLGKKAGTLVYRAYAGYRPLDLTGGYVKSLNLDLALIDAEFGLPVTPVTVAPPGNVFGGDVRWQTPLKGLLIGSSAFDEDEHGSAGAVAIRVVRNTVTQQYAQFERGKFFAAVETRRLPVTTFAVVTTAGGPIVIPDAIDWRSWHVMTSYRVSEKLQIGTYYSHFVNAGSGAGNNTALISNYSKDWTVSSRYDFNSYFYGKLEEHFIHGTALGYYSDTNPNGEKPRSNVLAAKIGFSF
ncbi:MAG: hypothetical protein ACLPHP_12550 [Candidatus Sulfotelmatobacter sp.]